MVMDAYKVLYSIIIIIIIIIIVTAVDWCFSGAGGNGATQDPGSV